MIKVKSQENAAATYVLDEDEFGALDEQSLEILHGEEADSPGSTGETSTIEELMGKSGSEDRSDSDDDVHALGSAPSGEDDVPTEELLAPELLFPADPEDNEDEDS